VGMKHEIAQMLRQTSTGGAIVNVSSVNGLGGARMGALYSAAKAGVLALTKSAAQEYGRQGIRVQALVAGAVDTPMLNHSLERITRGRCAGEGKDRRIVQVDDRPSADSAGRKKPRKQLSGFVPMQRHM